MIPERESSGNRRSVEPGGHFSLRRLWALCWKETLQIVRDPSTMIIAIILPVLLMLLFGFGISLDANRVAVGVALEDSGADARSFAAAVDGSPYLDAHFAPSRAALEPLLVSGAIRGLVVVPSDFSAQVARSMPGAIQVITDGSEPNTASFVANYLQGVWQSWLVARAQDQGGQAALPVTLEPRYWFNPTSVSRNFLIPGAVSVIMTIIGALLTSLVIAREWERGTMEALLAAPITRAELLLSKVLPYYVLALVSVAVCVLLATELMNVPFRGPIWLLVLFASLFLGSALGIGLLLSAATRNQFNAAQAALYATFLPSALLSGMIFEIASMPQVVQIITFLVPARYLVAALQTLFQAGTVWSVLGVNMLFLTCSAVFWLGLTALKMRRRLDG